MAAIVSAINNKNVGDIRASANTDGQLVLSSASGQDIKVENMTSSIFIRRYTDINGTESFEGLLSDTAVDPDGLVASTNIGAAGDYTLDGTLKDSTDLNGVVTITTGDTTDASGMTFTVTGTDMDGDVQTETITGPAVATSGLVVHGSKVFKTVTNINVDGDAGVVKIGVAGTGTDIDSLIETSTNIAAAGTYTLTGVLADSQNS